MASGLSFFLRFDGCRRQKLGHKPSLNRVAGHIFSPDFVVLFLGTRSMDIKVVREETRYFKIQEKTRLGQNSEARGLKLFGIFETEKERWKDRFLAV